MESSQTPLRLTRNMLKRAVFLPIDVQESYCRIDPCNPESRGSNDTENVARAIAGLAPVFNRYGLETAWVYYTGFYDDTTGVYDETGPTSPLYLVQPQPNDVLVAKEFDSAFVPKHQDGQPVGPSELHQYLLRSRKDVLIVAGVNFNACVAATVKDALQMGFHVIVLRDLVANDSLFKSILNDAGWRTQQDYMSYFNDFIRDKDHEPSSWLMYEKEITVADTITKDADLPRRSPNKGGTIAFMRSNDVLKALHTYHKEAQLMRQKPVTHFIQKAAKFMPRNG